MTKTHKMTKSPEYITWRGMIERCSNPKNNHYHIYGSEGVSVCDRWKSFENFFEDMGCRPAGMTLDRHPNMEGNYEPENCRWATPGEQSRNTRRTVLIEWGGETLCRKDWADRLGITSGALKNRIEKWGLEKAVTTQKMDCVSVARHLSEEQVRIIRKAKLDRGRFWNPMEFAIKFGVCKESVMSAALYKTFVMES